MVDRQRGYAVTMAATSVINRLDDAYSNFEPLTLSVADVKALSELFVLSSEIIDEYTDIRNLVLRYNK